MKEGYPCTPRFAPPPPPPPTLPSPLMLSLIQLMAIKKKKNLFSPLPHCPPAPCLTYRFYSTRCLCHLTLSWITTLKAKLLISNFPTNQISQLNNFPVEKFWATPALAPGREIRLCSGLAQPITIPRATAGQWEATDNLSLWHLREYMTVPPAHNSHSAHNALPVFFFFRFVYIY